MSAYIVNDKTINRILTFLYSQKASGGMITKILLKIDKTPEGKLRKTLFNGYSYIDTPAGNYKGEKHFYSNIYEYYRMNMEQNEFDRLLHFIFTHPTQVRIFMRGRK